MNPTELKELAKWSAEFLGFEVHGGVTGDSFYCREVMEGGHSYDTSIILDSPKFAAYFMHLGKREMEKRGLNWHGNVYINSKDNSIEYYASIYSVEFDFKRETQISKVDTNEYIAFWSAVREALK